MDDGALAERAAALDGAPRQEFPRSAAELTQKTAGWTRAEADSGIFFVQLGALGAERRLSSDLADSSIAEPQGQET
jgi:hypothetical protein